MTLHAPQASRSQPLQLHVSTMDIHENDEVELRAMHRNRNSVPGSNALTTTQSKDRDSTRRAPVQDGDADGSSSSVFGPSCTSPHLPGSASRQSSNNRNRPSSREDTDIQEFKADEIAEDELSEFDRYVVMHSK